LEAGMSASRSDHRASFWGVPLVLLALAICFVGLALKSTAPGRIYAPAERGTIPVGEIHAPANWLIPS
jgi:hypothetical protein